MLANVPATLNSTFPRQTPSSCSGWRSAGDRARTSACGVHLSVGRDAKLSPGRNQGLDSPDTDNPERRSETIAKRWLVGGLTTSPPQATHVMCGASRADRLPGRAGSGSLPRILVDQPLHAPLTDHLTAGNCKAHSPPTRRMRRLASSKKNKTTPLPRRLARRSAPAQRRCWTSCSS